MRFDRHSMLERVQIDQRVGHEPTQTGYESFEFEYEMSDYKTTGYRLLWWMIDKRLAKHVF